MIQFNLLPSVKLEYVKAKRNKRLTVLAASVIGGASLVILIIIFISVQYVQKNYSKALADDIKKQGNTLEGTKDLNKILTIQNQLTSLTALHDKKPVSALLFGYIKQFTPAKASIASIKTDFDQQTMDITGAADSINTINKFVDTLKFTSYSVTYNKEEQKQQCVFSELSYDENTHVQMCMAFSEVVLDTFGRDEKGASYEIKLKYDPAIFSGSRQPTLNVPSNKVTTRSEIEKPGEKSEDLFRPLSNPEEIKH